MLLGERILLIELSEPIGVGITVSIRIIVRLAPGLAILRFRDTTFYRTSGSLEIEHFLECFIFIYLSPGAVLGRTVEVQGKGIGIHGLRDDGRALETEVVVITDRRLSRASLLRRDEDYAECGP